MLIEWLEHATIPLDRGTLVRTVHWSFLMLTVRQNFLDSLDRWVVTASYAIIGTELGALSLAPWIATAYVLDFVSSFPIRRPPELSLSDNSFSFPLLKPYMGV